jgi:predicted nucleotide-binding protein
MQSEWRPPPVSGGSTPPLAGEVRKVFVVYGHADQARTQLEAVLRRWKVEPLLLDQLPSGGQTIMEKLESVRRDANFAVVPATPDDEGYAKGKLGEKAFRVRQNVALELGMMLAHLGRPGVAILISSDVKMEPVLIFKVFCTYPLRTVWKRQR